MAVEWKCLIWGIKQTLRFSRIVVPYYTPLLIALPLFLNKRTSRQAPLFLDYYWLVMVIKGIFSGLGGVTGWKACFSTTLTTSKRPGREVHGKKWQSQFVNVSFSHITWPKPARGSIGDRANSIQKKETVNRLIVEKRTHWGQQQLRQMAKKHYLRGRPLALASIVVP